MRNYRFKSILTGVLVLSILMLGILFDVKAVEYGNDIKNPSIDIKSFGARGDGKADDTKSLQEAFQSIPPFWEELKDPVKFPPGKVNRYSRNQPYMVIIPPGTYKVSETLNLNFKNRLVIMGYGARILWDGKDHGTLFDCRNSSFLTIKGLFIHGNGKLGTAFRFGVSPDAYKDYMNSNVPGIHLEDVTITRIIRRENSSVEERQAVIDTIGDYSRPYLTSVQDSLFENVIIETGEIGYAIGTTEVRFVGGLIVGLMEGVRFYSATTASFYGVTFTGGAGTHITVYKDSFLDSLRFYGAYFEGYYEALMKEIGRQTKTQNLNILLFDGCLFSNPAPEFISLRNKNVNLYLIGNTYFKNPEFSKFNTELGSDSNVIVLESYTSERARPTIKGGKILKISGGTIEKDGITIDFSDIEPKEPCKEGNIIYNRKPSIGGYAGWICTKVDGKLKWRGFGKVE